MNALLPRASVVRALIVPALFAAGVVACAENVVEEEKARSSSRLGNEHSRATNEEAPDAGDAWLACADDTFACDSGTAVGCVPPDCAFEVWPTNPPREDSSCPTGGPVPEECPDTAVWKDCVFVCPEGREPDGCPSGACP